MRVNAYNTLAAVENELELDKLHVDQLRVDGLMGYTHPNVLHLGQVALQGIVQTILELDEVGDLRNHNETAR